MPIHDWIRVEAGVYHDFHNSWIIHLKEALNLGVLPKGYSALSDQRVSLTEPDIIPHSEAEETEMANDGGVATAVEVAIKPRIEMKAEARPARKLRRRRRVVIRRDNDDRVVAIIEITSPGNKDSRRKVRSLAEKIVAYLEAGVHVLLVDVLPPGKCDPLGIHEVVWEYFGRKTYTPTPEEPLTLVSYRFGAKGTVAMIEPTAVGQAIPRIPLFLAPALAVGVPLDATYLQALRGMGERYRQAIEASPMASGQA